MANIKAFNVFDRPSENTLENVLNFIAKGIESISGVTHFRST